MGPNTLDEPCPACAHQVSVLERLNPGGAYLTRVHRLNHFARAGQLVLHDRCLLVSCAVGWTLNKRMHALSPLGYWASLSVRQQLLRSA